MHISELIAWILFVKSLWDKLQQKRRSFKEQIFVRDNRAWKLKGLWKKKWSLLWQNSQKFLCNFHCWTKSIVEPANLECSLTFSSVNPLIPESSVMTHFLSLSPSVSATYHVWPPCCVGCSLQLLLICRSTVQPFSSSEGYMTNHTNHFKQFELSLAINHLDTNYCAHIRAALRREEGKRSIGRFFSSFGHHTTVLWKKLRDWDESVVVLFVFGWSQ